MSITPNLRKYFSRPQITAIDNDYVLDLRYTNLTVLSKDDLKNKTSYYTIDLSSNNLEFITPHLLENLPNLLNLKVNLNPKFTIRKTEAFLHSKSLLLFSAVECGFESVYKRSFDGVPKLEVLDLSGNKIKSLDDDAFTKNINLINVNLSRNSLKSIDSEIFVTNERLEILDLSHNTNLKNEKEKPFILNKNLAVLYLNKCHLESIDAETFRNLTNLTELFLAGNFIIEVDSKAFQSMPLLTNVSLENNLLRSLAPSIIGKNMQNLCLDQNKFRLTRGYVKLYSKYERKGLIKDNQTTICRNKNETLKFEWFAMQYKLDPTKAGISTAFISTYLLAILLAEVAILVGLVFCFMKLKKKFKPEDYSQTILNENSIYKICKTE